MSSGRSQIQVDNKHSSRVIEKTFVGYEEVMFL